MGTDGCSTCRLLKKQSCFLCGVSMWVVITSGMLQRLHSMLPDFLIAVVGMLE